MVTDTTLRTISPIEAGTSYFGAQDLEHVAADLDRFCEAGLDAVLDTFSERDRAFYSKTMDEIVTASRNKSLTTYVSLWAVGRVFGGKEFSRFVAHNPHSRQMLNTGEQVPAACFNDPTFREFMCEWTRDAAGLGADVLFWDERHWHNVHWYGDDHLGDVWCCWCDHCREQYRKRHDADACGRNGTGLDFPRGSPKLNSIEECQRQFEHSYVSLIRKYSETQRSYCSCVWWGLIISITTTYVCEHDQ